MRQKISMKKMIMSLLAGAVIWLALSVIKTEASQQTYTVTYRAGNVGCFALTGTRETEKKAMAEEVAELLYTGNPDITDRQVTDNGAIKLTVRKEAAVPVAPGAGYVQTQAGYFVKNVSAWGPKEGECVVRNVDYVVDYGKLVNGVEYTISYVDAVSKNSIAPIAIAYGNVGDKVEITAPDQITLSGVARYFLQGSALRTMTLSQDSTANVLEFTYQAEPDVVEINEIVEYEEGDTVVVTKTVTVPGQTRENAGAVLASGQTRSSAGAVLALGQTEENAGADTTPAQQPSENSVLPEVTNLEEEQIPLTDAAEKADGQEEEQTASQETVTSIEEEQTALSDGVKDSGNNGIYLVVAIAGALFAAAVSVYWRYRKKSAQDD